MKASHLNYSPATALIALLIVCCSLELQAQTDPTPPPPPAIATEEEIFKVVEHMPQFPGCGYLPSKAERSECTEQHLQAFLRQYLYYPPAAAEQGLEGWAVIQIIVEKDGSITNERIAKDPGLGLGEAALTAVQEMSKQQLRWDVAMRARTRPLRIQLEIPIEFKLDGSIPILKHTPPGHER
jgi:TonB family protein